MAKLADYPVWMHPDDLFSDAYRMFDHWLKHVHEETCEHEYLTDCIEVYGALQSTNGTDQLPHPWSERDR